MEKLELILELPGLAAAEFEITSPKTKTYNCIAWAAGETHRRWWPDKMKVEYWPPGVVREQTVTAFMAAYATLGYEACEKDDLENGYEKIAIFLKPGGTPTHAARQLPSGRWTSRLGPSQDIEHDLRSVEGRGYGQAKQFMRRPMRASPTVERPT